MKGDSHCPVEVRPSPEFPGPPPPRPTHHLLHPRRPGEKNRAGSSTPGGGRRPRSEAGLGQRGCRGRGAGAPDTHRCGREGRCAAAGLPVAGEAGGWGLGLTRAKRQRRRAPAPGRGGGGGDRSPARFLLGQIPGPSPPAGRRPAESPAPPRARHGYGAPEGAGRPRARRAERARAPGEGGTRRGGARAGKTERARGGRAPGEGARAGRTGRERGGRAPGEGARAPGGGGTRREEGARAGWARTGRGGRAPGGGRARQKRGRAGRGRARRRAAPPLLSSPRRRAYRTWWALGCSRRSLPWPGPEP